MHNCFKKVHFYLFFTKKYDDLKKLKELLDSDIITKEEYEIEKSKILGY